MLLTDSFIGDQTFHCGGDAWRYLPVHREQVTGWLWKGPCLCFWIPTYKPITLTKRILIQQAKQEVHHLEAFGTHFMLCLFFSRFLHSRPHVWTQTHRHTHTQALSPWRARRSPKPTGPGCEHPQQVPKASGMTRMEAYKKPKRKNSHKLKLQETL